MQIPEDFDAPGDMRVFFSRFPELYKNWKGRPAFEEALKPDKALGRYLYYQEHEPIKTFKPNLPQSLLFYSLNRHGEMPRILMLEGSNKCGKSTGAVAWQIAMGVGFYPWLDPVSLTGDYLDNFEWSRSWQMHREVLRYCGFKSYRELQEKFFWLRGDKGGIVKKLKVPNVNLAIGETYTESVEKDLVPKYIGGPGAKGLIPKSWKPKTKKNQQGVVSKITLEAGPGKGSIFYFRSYKSPADEFEGIDVSGSILFNEPPPEDLVTSVLRGALPYDTRAMFAYTALKEPWIYREYVNKASKWLI